MVAVVEDHNLKVTDPFALDLLALSIDDDVVARANVDQVLEGVVHVPRAATVNDDVEPTQHAVRGAPGLPLGRVTGLELGGS